MVVVSGSPRRSAHNRPALIVLVVVATSACLALGWWQWERFDSASGTGQNLGYALQWPLFAAFAVFAYFRFVRLEQEAEETTEQPSSGRETDRATVAASADSTGRSHAGGGWKSFTERRAAKTIGPREIPAGILPERPTAARDADPVLAEYNKYLAQLNADDIGEQVRAAGLRRDTERSAG